MERYNHFLTRLNNGEIIMIDGGTGTEVERRGVPQLQNAWNASGNVSHPNIIRKIHEDFIKAGSEIVISNTFATSKHLLKDAGCPELFEEYNRRAVELVVEARVNTNKDDVLVAGGISHWSFTNILPSIDELREGAKEQAMIMRDAGADLIMLEMMIDVPRMMALIEGVKEANLPIWVGLSCEPDSQGTIRLLSGQKDLKTSARNERIAETLEEAIRALDSKKTPLLSIMHTDVQHVNACLDIVEKFWDGLVGVYAHSGDDINMKWTFDDVISIEQHSEFCKSWMKRNINIIGGCCGITPEHIRDLKKYI